MGVLPRPGEARRRGTVCVATAIRRGALTRGRPIRMDVRFRPGTPDDSPAVFDVFRRSVIDLGERLRVETLAGGSDPETLRNLWTKRRPLFEHLAATASHWWVAEGDEGITGYARSTLRDGIHELTEFFVAPGHQSAGVGRELLARAFPAGVGHRRLIIATPDTRALARYLKLGLVARGVVRSFERPARALASPPGLEAIALEPGPDALAALAEIDAQVLGFRRDEDHAFLLGQRSGFLYRRDGKDVGYGYIGDYDGPFAALDPHAQPDMLAHAEGEAARRGQPEFGVDVPLHNRAALDHVLAGGFKMGDFTNHVLDDGPIGHLDRYICTTPTFFL
jgi:GNAT superfamily N-acetyltransferase